MASALASRYARAFADVIMARGADFPPEEAVAQLCAIENVVSESSDLRHALSSPAVRLSQKRTVLKRIAEDLKLKLLTRNFLYVLVDHGRMGVLREIREAFESEIDQRLGFLRADVASAQELDGGQSSAIEASLSSMTGKQVRARFRVDPSLIGGVVARIGSTVYDGSLRGQLETMRREIAEHTAAGL